MRTCFVIQPFDGGPFDRRYEDVLSPAIQAADLKAYRVDRDPHASIPIDQIEAKIRDSVVCLADISEDNPNVWFELGYAIAAGKEVAIVCNNERERFPFDVQHRQIIRYSKESLSDFARLQERITERLAALASRAQRLEVAASQSSVAEVGGLSSHEFLTLVSIAERVDTPDGSVSAYHVREEAQRMGCTNIAVTLALKGLTKRQFVAESSRADDPEFGSYPVFGLTEQGFEWLESNRDKLVLHRASTSPDDEIPF